nr:hypothetical protein [Streptomyces sp. NBC_00576]
MWPHHRFPLSPREAENLMPERGTTVASHETIRRWYATFGQAHTGAPRHRHPRPGDKRHLDEAFIKTNGRLPYP